MKLVSVLFLLLAGQSSFAITCNLTTVQNGAPVSQTFKNVPWNTVSALPNGFSYSVNDTQVGIDAFEENVNVFTANGTAMTCTRSLIEVNGYYSEVKSDCGAFSVACDFAQ